MVAIVREEWGDARGVRDCLVESELGERGLATSIENHEKNLSLLLLLSLTLSLCRFKLLGLELLLLL